MTSSEINALHEDLGAAYAAAAEAYLQAYINLAAMDGAVSNSNVPNSSSRGRMPPTFADRPYLALHPRFFPEAKNLNGPAGVPGIPAKLSEYVATLIAPKA